MEIELEISGNTFSRTTDNPFHLDIRSLIEEFKELIGGKGISIDGIDLEGLIPRMIKGVFGCEEGCPADAKRLVQEGYDGFRLEYIEGGILKAEYDTGSSGKLTVKVFPDF
ncbi:MAG TPA: hypothetical protein ENK09_12530 [Nitrospirae bacterium]|nr:hypothetical protein [Nitrospirota bacterium]